MAERAELQKWYADNRVQGTDARFRDLDKRERYWKGMQYDHLQYDWDLVDADPDTGNYSGHQSKDEVPLRVRRPSIRYNIIRVAVNTLTGYLFGHRSAPTVSVPGNPAASAFVRAVADEGFWARWVQLRSWGGGTGTVCCVVKAVDGFLKLERVNPKLVTVEEWADEEEMKPARVRIDRLIVRDEEDPKTPGRTVERVYLRRRVIDTARDVVFQDVLLSENGRSTLARGEEIRFVELPEGEGSITHSLDVCPVVYGHNFPAEEDDALDGLPDCDDAYSLLDSLARQASQVNRALLNNLDPTTILKMEFERLQEQQQNGGIAKGSYNAIAVGPDGDAKYLELGGQFIYPSEKVMNRFEAWFQRLVGVVFPDPQHATGFGQGRAVMEYLLSPMLNRVDVLRAQYAKLVARSLELARLIAVRAERTGSHLYVAAPDTVNEADGDGESPDGGGTGGAPEVAGEAAAQMLPSGGEVGSVVVRWSRSYVQSTITEAQSAATVVSTLKDVVPVEFLATFIAPHIGVEDVDALARGMRKMADGATADRKASLDKLTGMAGGFTQTTRAGLPEVPGGDATFGDVAAAEQVLGGAEVE